MLTTHGVAVQSTFLRLPDDVSCIIFFSDCHVFHCVTKLCTFFSIHIKKNSFETPAFSDIQSVFMFIVYKHINDSHYCVIVSMAAIR